MMSKLIQNTLIFALVAGLCTLTLLWQKEKAKSNERQCQIKELHALIERVSGERIMLNITNNFRNTAVLGKATTTANVENNARQQAAIIKRELEGLSVLPQKGEVKVPYISK
ncbi:MAG: hypothetical protein ACRCZB_04635 [Bacteroidales bacterium]